MVNDSWVLGKRSYQASASTVAPPTNRIQQHSSAHQNNAEEHNLGECQQLVRLRGSEKTEGTISSQVVTNSKIAGLAKPVAALAAGTLPYFLKNFVIHNYNTTSL
jgi:hypothetical protein